LLTIEGVGFGSACKRAAQHKEGSGNDRPEWAYSG
jgi:hypothetical protein